MNPYHPYSFTDEVAAALAQAPIFAKKGRVRARVAVPGEKVVTVLANGSEETVNIAGEGDIVVMNPGGEQYILAPDNFVKRYEATEEVGVFRAKGMVRALQNPTGSNIKLIDQRKDQFGDADCMIATLHDPALPEAIGSDCYLIGHDEFLSTYTPAILARTLIDFSLIL